MHFLLIYDVVPDFVARRAPYRDEHLALAWQSADAGDLDLGGALEEPTEHAFLLFNSPTPQAAIAFAQADPYVLAGLVTRWRVKQWNTVVGKHAATPRRPQS